MSEVAPGTSKIFVRYRNTKPSEDELQEIFSKHGTITDVKLYAKFCFIEYDSEASAEVAVAAENGTVFRGTALEVETVVRNVQKRKPEATEAEASSSIEIAASESQKSPSTVAKKPKQEVLPPTDLSASDAAEAIKVIIAKSTQGEKVREAESTLGDVRQRVRKVRVRKVRVRKVCEAEKSEDACNALDLEEKKPELTRNERWLLRLRARKAKDEALAKQLGVSVETLLYQRVLAGLSSSSNDDSLRSSSKDLCKEPSSENKLLSTQSHGASSAPCSHDNQPLNSYGPNPVYPDYVSNSVPPVNSNQYSSTIDNWSGYLPAPQTYTTAYPRADSRSYSSSYVAECSQVNTFRPETYNYGGHEKTDVWGLKQAVRSEHRPSDNTHITQGEYAMQRGPTGPGKMDSPHLPDLVNYSSAHYSLKSSSSGLNSRESRNPGYGSNLEAYRSSSSHGALSSLQARTSVADSPGHVSSASATEHSGICELIITEPNLRQYGLKVASKIHSTGLTVEISDLPPGMTVMEEVEDAMIRGRLFAVVITERHAEHNSVTVDVLHGVAEEHRNMVVEDAVRLITNSYQEYLAAKRASAKSSAVSESSKDVVDVAPSELTQVLITRLARNQYLSHEELEELISYLRRRQDALRKESSVLRSLPGQNTAPQEQGDSVDVKLQKKLEATIFSILKGDAQAQQQATSTKSVQPTYIPAGSYLPPGRRVESGGPYNTSSDYRRY